MSLLFNRAATLTAAELIADRTSGRTNGRASKNVSRSNALHHSGVWASLRLRADLISTMPVDVFRRIDGIQVEQTKPPVLVTPGGTKLRMMEWMYSTQVDLDSVGNTVGVIRAFDGAGIPSVIELANTDQVTFIGKGSTITKVRIGSTEYPYELIWHEKQFTVAGLPVGLSPVAHAAMSINSYLSAQEFASDWFGNSTVPGGHLKNTAKVLKKKEAAAVKANFKASVQSGDVWVSGSDWEYSMLSAKASESSFLESMQFSLSEQCRFFGVPGDMIDVPVAGGAITYANITQRNLQLLIINIGPAIARREEAISFGLLPRPRYMKLNTAALLRMDTRSRLEGHKVAIDSRIYPPSRALDMENMAPLTPDEEAEFARLFPAKSLQPTPGANPQGGTQ